VHSFALDIPDTAEILVAQIGSHIPADAATAFPLEGIFTRMGAGDDLAAGVSTFMLELSRTSLILQRSTPRSLVILDELGRGTSTHDGVAIAMATLKYLSQSIRTSWLLRHIRAYLGSIPRNFAVFDSQVARRSLSPTFRN
jgi:DNA mismatch repair protein MSH3